MLCNYVTEQLYIFSHTITGSSSAYNFCFGLIGQLRTTTRSVYNFVCCAAGLRHGCNITFLTAPITPTHSQLIRCISSDCSFLLNRGKRLSDGGSVLHSFSPVTKTLFSEFGSFSLVTQFSSGPPRDMDPYFEASYAKLGTSSCKKCKERIEKGALRLAKVLCAKVVLILLYYM